MKYLLIILLLGCKKPDTITWQLHEGAGNVVITDNGKATNFRACNEGWEASREAKPQTRYTIWTNAKQYREVRILYNGKVVAKDSVFTAFTTE